MNVPVRVATTILSASVTGIGIGVMATYFTGKYDATAITGHTPIASGTGLTFVLIGINQLILSLYLTHKHKDGA